MNKTRSIKKVVALLPLILCYQLLFAGVSVLGRYVLLPGQFPSSLSKTKADWAYVFFTGPLAGGYANKFGNSLKGDTIINYKRFIDSVGKTQAAYRLIFNTGNTIDSLWQMNSFFVVTDKAFPHTNNKLKVFAYDDNGKQTDHFIFDYGRKYRDKEIPVPTLQQLIKEKIIYSAYERNRYAQSYVWMLSVGIDDYGDTKYKNSKSDATSYINFFRDQFNTYTSNTDDTLFTAWLLLDKDATKDSILKVLKLIASKASSNDYFIFNFSGQSNLFTTDSVNYFFPYDVTGYIFTPKNRKTNDTTGILNNLISQNLLQEYIQLIPATNQLFISEAGPSSKFKTEFIKTLMNNSISLAGVLNKNRVIIVPNKYGLDNLYCKNLSTGKAPLNYIITNLAADYNIYNLFDEGAIADRVAYLLKTSLFLCNSGPVNESYMDVFFERKFLQEYRSIVGESEGKTRGIRPKTQQLKEASGLSGKKYAMIVGTNNYKARGWDNLNNPVFDAREVSAELEHSFGFETELLIDPPMDSIYMALRRYYLELNPDDQFLIYFAGHGDYDEGLMDDGFIVCTDSKPVDDDPIRNSYIQYSKLQKMINKIPARQILLMLDVCHAGVFDENVLGKQRDNPTSNLANRNVMEFLKDKSQYKTRKMLSSVGKESAFDGAAGKHSPFANLLLQILRARGAGTNGIITLADIYAVLQTASLNETATLKISPHIAGFGENDPLSEFILIPAETENK